MIEQSAGIERFGSSLFLFAYSNEIFQTLPLIGDFSNNYSAVFLQDQSALLDTSYFQEYMIPSINFQFVIFYPVNAT